MCTHPSSPFWVIHFPESILKEDQETVALTVCRGWWERRLFSAITLSYNTSEIIGLRAPAPVPAIAMNAAGVRRLARPPIYSKQGWW